MDFNLLVFLLIFLAPLLKRLFEKRQPKPTPKRVPPESRPAPSERPDDPLGEALRQIREALSEPAPPPRPLPKDPEPVVAKPVAAKPDGEFRSLGEFKHEAHGFGPENPLSEEVFEQRPRFAARAATERIKQKPLGDVDLTTPLEVATAAGSSSSDLSRLLRDPERAREAFVLKEILDAPRSRRRR